MKKDKTIATLLAMFPLTGSVGLQKSYLYDSWRKTGLFMVPYVLLSRTGISAILSFIEGLVYRMMSEERFDRIYNPELRSYYDSLQGNEKFDEDAYIKEYRKSFEEHYAKAFPENYTKTKNTGFFEAVTPRGRESYGKGKHKKEGFDHRI